MIAFDSILNAVKFALQAQEMLLLADWPSNILNHPSTSIVRTPKGLIFRGIRVRMVVKNLNILTKLIFFTNHVFIVSLFLGSLLKSGE